MRTSERSNDMTTAVRTADSAGDPRIERYREAERTLWARYGLHPIERIVQLEDPRIRVRILDIGAGDPVLFIPGPGGTGPYWAPLIRELAGFRCLLVDRPGWGLTDPIDWRKGDYGSIAAAILRGTLDDLGIERAHVVGASIGNLWGLHLARRHPDRVVRMAFIGGHPTVEVPVPRFIRLLRSPIGAVIVRAPLSAGALRSQLRAIGHAASLESGKLAGFFEWRLAFAKDTSSMRYERAMVQAVLGPDGWRPGFVPTTAELAQIDHPTRMIFGTGDPTGTVDTWRKFTERLPRGELQIIDGAGHMPWWDEPQIVGQSVVAFLRAQETGATT